MNNEIIRRLVSVVAYFDDMIASSNYAIQVCFERLGKYNVELPSKVFLGATKADFLGRTTSPTGVSPNTDNVAALTNTPIPNDLTQLRSPLGGLGFYRKLL